jgi:hypothetical protein
VKCCKTYKFCNITAEETELPRRHETCLANIAVHIELQFAQSECSIAYGGEPAIFSAWYYLVLDVLELRSDVE